MSKYQVCPQCEGEGLVDGLGAYTSDEFAESFMDFEEYQDMWAVARKACPLCHGKRVATQADIDEDLDRREAQAMMRAECGIYG